MPPVIPVWDRPAVTLDLTLYLLPLQLPFILGYGLTLPLRSSASQFGDSTQIPRFVCRLRPREGRTPTQLYLDRDGDCRGGSAHAASQVTLAREWGPVNTSMAPLDSASVFLAPYGT
jgi:hypothetical protein